MQASSPHLSRRVADVHVLQHFIAECQLQWASTSKADEHARLTAAPCALQQNKGVSADPHCV